MTSVAVSGATGAMGRSVRDAIAMRDDLSLALAITRSDPTVVDEHVPVTAPDAVEEAFAERDVDVLVDFSVAPASVELVTAAARSGVAAVVGTTGFEDGDREQLHRASADVPVLVAPNFSRGIATLRAALETVVGGLPGYDIEVTETHHNRKRDAPSGTANQLVEVIEAERPDANRVHGRQGETPRKPGEIGIHARRAGTVTGEHEVLLAGNDEELRLVHRAESRQVFAAGALDAAAWIAGKPSGWYRFEDVLGA